MVDAIKATRIQEKEIRSQLDRMEVTELIRTGNYGNIFEVLSSSKIKLGDLADFFSDQWKAYRGQVIQDAEIKAQEASVPEPNVREFPEHENFTSIGHEEVILLNEEMGEALGRFGRRYKAQHIGKAQDADGDTAMSREELENMAGGTISEWDQFLEDTWSQIIDAETMRDYQSRMGEIQREVDRIISLVKQGAIGPEFALLALAKVTVTKNGVLMVGLGRKVSHINDSMNNITNSLHTMSPADPRYGAESQFAAGRTRELGFQSNLLMNDMNKIMQDTASVFEQVNGMIGEINRTRREIVTKVAAR